MQPLCRCLAQLRTPLSLGYKAQRPSDLPVPQTLRGPRPRLDEHLTIPQSPRAPVSFSFPRPALSWVSPVGAGVLVLGLGRSSLSRLPFCRPVDHCFVSPSCSSSGSHSSSHHRPCLGVKLHRDDFDACNNPIVVVLAFASLPAGRTFVTTGPQSSSHSFLYSRSIFLNSRSFSKLRYLEFVNCLIPYPASQPLSPSTSPQSPPNWIHHLDDKALIPVGPVVFC